MAKISSLMIAMIVISVFCIFFTATIINIHSEYNPVSSINEGQLTNYNELSAINSTAINLQKNVNAINGSKNVLDILNAYFGAGYNTLKLSGQSTDLAVKMASSSASMIPTGGATYHGLSLSKYLSVAIGAIIIIIVVFIFIKAITKTDS